MTPIVSVVVPICNVEKYVGECLESLRKQTLEEMEFICIDDGSTDRSLQVMQRFAERDKRFKIYSGANAGYGAALNKGLDLCTGKYVGILESDDFCDPDFYADLVKIAEEKDCDLVKSDLYRYWNTGKYSLFQNFDDILYDVVFDPQTVLKNHNLFESQSCIWSAIYRRDVLEENNIRCLPTPGASYQDLSFSVKVFMSFKSVYITKRAYIYYRQTETQSIKSLGKPWFAFEEYAEVERHYPMSPQMFAAKYHNYMWNYNRVGIEYKYKFMKIFSEQFRKHLIDNPNIVDEKLFHPWEPAHLKMICSSALMYHDFRIREIYDLEGWNIIPAEKPKTLQKNAPISPFISIIVPCYNVEYYLLSCLESLLNQDDADDVEIICVNDCSTDRTGELLDYTAGRDGRLKVIHQEKNAGVSATRNTGIRSAQGEYILFVDSDDMLETNAISILRSKLKKHDDVNVLNFSASVFPAEKENDWFRDKFKKTGDFIAQTKFKDFFSRKEFNPHIWINLVKRECIEQKDIYFDEEMSLGEDTFWLQRLFENMSNVMIIPEKLYLYRIRENSLMSQLNPDNQINILRKMFVVMAKENKNFLTQPYTIAWSIEFVYGTIAHSPLHIKKFLDLLYEFGYKDTVKLAKHYENIMENDFKTRI
ncbi:hypothetical protein FACS1894132_01200 [Clostridia bacterium]|nr:hypothetical protein FACS1894132_01200 [Clostridia bacterium]